MRIGRAAALATMLLAGCATPRIGSPPPGLDPFYLKSLDADGIPVSSSAVVSDRALVNAQRIVRAMLARRPDIARALVAQGQRVVVMAESEGTLDLPEQRDWRKPAIDDPRLTRCERKHYDERIGRLSDRDYWNARARGMGGLLTSAAEENLLARRGTRYYGENILVHEFSHAILGALETVDPAFYGAVVRAYEDSRERGSWRGEYGDTNVHEYWAEGTQFWFESNKIAVVGGVRILSTKDLADHDPSLAALLRQIYGDRHRLPGDRFWRHKGRTPAGGVPTSTAEIC